MRVREARRARRLWAGLLALLISAVGTGVVGAAEGQPEFAGELECEMATMKPCYPTAHGTFAPDTDPDTGGRTDFDGEWLDHAGRSMPVNFSGTRQNPVVTVDMEQVAFPDAQPYLDPDLGRVRVPLRFVSEKMGAEVGWVAETRTVTIVRGDLTIVLRVDDPVIEVNGVEKRLDAPPVIKDDRTMVPLRAISEMFGATVDWVGDQAPGVRPDFPGHYQVWIWIPWGYWGTAGLESRLQTDWYRRN